MKTIDLQKEAESLYDQTYHNTFTSDFEERALTLLKNSPVQIWGSLEENFPGMLIMMCARKGFFEAIEPLLDLGNSLIKIRDDKDAIRKSIRIYVEGENAERDRVDSHIDKVAMAVIGIGFPKDKLDAYSHRIHESFIKPFPGNFFSALFVEALAKARDPRAHEYVRSLMKQQDYRIVGQMYFEALACYGDKSDLALLEPFTKMEFERGMKFIRQDALKSYNKLSRAVERAEKKK